MVWAQILIVVSHKDFNISSSDPDEATITSPMAAVMLLVMGRCWMLCGCYGVPTVVFLHTPPKTNMTMENHHFLKEIHLQMVVFHCHVSFRGCTFHHSEVSIVFIWGPWDAQAAQVFERHEPYQVQVMGHSCRQRMTCFHINLGKCHWP